MATEQLVRQMKRAREKIITYTHKESKKDFELNTRILCVCFVIKSAQAGARAKKMRAHCNYISVTNQMDDCGI